MALTPFDTSWHDIVAPPVFVIPALDAEQTIATVVRGLFELSADARVIVVDDGSRDGTASRASEAGAQVVTHPVNRGKGAALRTGFLTAREGGALAATTLDADAQHSARDAWLLARHPAPADTLLLGIRDMRQAGAPRANQYSNRFSNFVLSAFSGKTLRDTQCGLRRYPLERTLSTTISSCGFAFESELLLTAALRDWPIEQLPVGVFYPPAEARVTHFDNVRDPARIVVRVVSTVLRHRVRRSWRTREDVG